MSVAVEHGTQAGGATPPATVRVWDPLVRVFHWSLVAAFVTAWATGDEVMSVHEFAGYVIVGLLVFRLAWGIVGSRHARFTDFVYGPATVIGFLKDSVILKARRYLGHNPAGGAMVIALLLTLAVITASGVMMTTDAFWGVRWVRETHETAVDVALVLVALHVAGVVLASIEHRENLVRAMITGRKRAPEAD
jgi:cytochrome b